MFKKDDNPPSNIRDVAKLAGVSIATVSLVLNNKPGIKEETKRKVLAAAKKLNYIPNIHAKRLFTKRTGCIGLIFASHIDDVLSNVVYSRVFRGASKFAEKKEYNLISVYGEKEFIETHSLPRIVLERQADGFLLIGRGISRDFAYALKEQNVPLASVVSLFENSNIPTVSPAFKEGTYIGVRYLASLGHRGIAFIDSPFEYWSSGMRLEGYRAALLEGGIGFKEELVFESDLTAEGGYVATKKLLEGKVGFTAISAANDATAIGAIKSLKETGLKVPEDVSVVGFDDIELSVYSDPPLTTVWVPWEEVGSVAVEVLLDVINGSYDGKKIVELPVKLVVRESCRDIARGGGS
jgi:LacI family transcriptional regulator